MIVAPLLVTEKVTFNPVVSASIVMGVVGSKDPMIRLTPVQAEAGVRVPVATIAFSVPPPTDSFAFGVQGPEGSPNVVRVSVKFAAEPLVAAPAEVVETYVVPPRV